MPVINANVALFLILNLYCNLINGQTPSWLWSQSTKHHWVSAMETDSQGNLLVTGSFNDSLILGNQTYPSDGTHDIIVVKYLPTGNVLWSKVFRGDNDEYTSAIAADASGNIFLAGQFTSKQFTIGNNVLQNTQTATGSFSFTDIFITKMDASGNVLWAQSFGHAYQEYITDLAVDVSGNVIVTGYFYNPLVIGTTTLLPAASPFGSMNFDFFVAKFSSQGAVMWAQRFGGSNDEYSRNITCDSQGNLLLSGSFSGTTLIGSTVLTGGGSDIYLVKLTPSGAVTWAQDIGGEGHQFPSGLECDAQDNLIVLGETTHILILTPGTFTIPVHGTSDLFLAKCDPAGTWLWAKTAGNRGSQEASDLCLDPGGNAYVTGRFFNDSLFVNQQLLLSTPDTLGALVIKFDPSGNAAWVKKVEGVGYHKGSNLACSSSGDLYFAGSAQGKAIFDAGTFISPTGKWISLLAKMHVYASSQTSLLDNHINAGSFELYPNPAQDNLRIRSFQAELQEIRIINCEGQVVKTCELKGGNETIIDLSGLAGGLYLVRFSGRNEVPVKIIKN